MTALSERFFLIAKFQVLTRLLYARKRMHAWRHPQRERTPFMVNVGGGLFFRPHWKVLDHVSPYYPFARRYIDYDVDLMKPAHFPFADGTVDFFYSAHTLEHIPHEFCASLLSEMYRCLRVGGAVRLNMPDYEQMRRAADQHDISYFPVAIRQNLTVEQAVVEQIATAMLGEVDAQAIARDYEAMTPVSFADHYTSCASREVQRQKGGYHINWFTFDKLAGMLRAAGFSDIYRSEPQASRFAQLRGEGGWLTVGDPFEIKRLLGIDTTLPEKSLFVEAVK